MNEDEEETDPWTTLSSDLQYANPWIEVTHHQVTAPAGTPGVYGVVHFWHLAVGVLPVDDDGYTWLVGQWRYPLKHYSWEIPEGGGEIGIDPVVSAQRELREETGIEARDWQLLLEMDLSNSVTDEHAYLYLATGISLGVATPEETESLKVRRIPVAEAIEMALDGRITDAMSVAALLRYKLLDLLSS